MPTPAQERVIRQFNGDRTAHHGHRSPSPSTYDICERNGWIEQIEEWPYLCTTDVGRAAIGADAPVGPPTEYTVASGQQVERATCRHDGRPIFRNQDVTGLWIHEDATSGRWCEGFKTTAAPLVQVQGAAAAKPEEFDKTLPDGVRPEPSEVDAVKRWIVDQIAKLSEEELLRVKAKLDELASAERVS